MRKKLIIIFVIIIVLIIGIFVTKNLILLNESRKGSFNFENENLPAIYSDELTVKRIETGKDEEGNPYKLIEYNPKKLIKGDIYSFLEVLQESEGYLDLNYGSLEEEKQLATWSQEEGKMIKISIHYDEDSAYVKYEKCDSIIPSREYFEQFEETEEVYYDDEESGDDELTDE